jgi:hypothetical protein
VVRSREYAETEANRAVSQKKSCRRSAALESPYPESPDPLTHSPIYTTSPQLISTAGECEVYGINPCIRYKQMALLLDDRSPLAGMLYGTGIPTRRAAKMASNASHTSNYASSLTLDAAPLASCSALRLPSTESGVLVLNPAPRGVVLPASLSRASFASL